MAKKITKQVYKKTFPKVKTKNRTTAFIVGVIAFVAIAAFIFFYSQQNNYKALVNTAEQDASEGLILP